VASTPKVRLFRVVATAALVAGALIASQVASGATSSGPGRAAAASTAAAAPAGMPRYDHIFVIVEENHGFTDVVGNPAAPNLNALAKQFGLATNYFGISHPSEPNYIAFLGGSTYGVTDDNAYYLHQFNQPNLMSQLDGAGVTWKAYLQGSPHPGYKGICFPVNCNGSPDRDPLFVSKHDAIENYLT
jgi:phospholipase C